MQKSTFTSMLDLLSDFDKTIFIDGQGEAKVNSIEVDDSIVDIYTDSGNICVDVAQITCDYRCRYFYSLHIKPGMYLLIHKSVPLSERAVSLAKLVEWGRDGIYLASSNKGILRVGTHTISNLQNLLYSSMEKTWYIADPSEDPENLAELFMKIVSLK